MSTLAVYTSDRGAVESVYIMDAIASKWKKLGIALGFSGPQLDSIERSKLKDVEDCCLELLEQWLQGRQLDSIERSKL